MDFGRLGLVLGGVLLFLFANVLARNALFYYTGGTGIGLLASLLIVVFILYRFLPRVSESSRRQPNNMVCFSLLRPF